MGVGEVCPMEGAKHCGFHQDSTDDFDWVFQAGGNKKYGPDYDVTYQSQHGGKLLFVLK